jgi:TRAP-type C4-dicarboxylate transport system substrate-binding protein
MLGLFLVVSLLSLLVYLYVERRLLFLLLSAVAAALAQLTKDGVTIVRLSPAQRAAFLDAAQPAVAAWGNAVGADLVDGARAAVAGAAK